MALRAQILVKGIVQGVGFRPFVYNLAASLELKGYVTNTSDGVSIEVEGARTAEFVEKLKSDAPPLSRITDISVTTLPLHGYPDFTIKQSLDQAGFTLVSPDVSICKDCLREMLDPADRRYLYPFINCTNCGPRYSITKSVPYDRPNTTMAVFPLCPACDQEYHDPRNRRFHAQPNACPVCGPVVEFRLRNADFGIKDKQAVLGGINTLKEGGIIAVKGIGGFHLACDALNDSAVKLLRERKRKSNKPFAVMVPSLEAAQEFCQVSDKEKEQLLSNRRPIVLLKKKKNEMLSEAVSPNNQFIGVMLPYTPLHYLLFQQPLSGENAVTPPHFKALVMTSGNLSEEPIVHENEEAVKKLGSLVDGFLLHNRDIFMRVDDSVVRVQSTHKNASFNDELRATSDELNFIRRSRGYAPDPIKLSDDGPEVLGCGADLKTTFTITKGNFAIPSQHIGDMENYETLKFYEETLANLKSVYRADPKVLVHDLHPGYGTTRWAAQQGQGARVKDQEEQQTKTYPIQHHYAHIGSVMAEHGLKNRVIGVAFDGTGYGTDGNLWGGEFLLAGIEGFERVGQLQYIPLPGGEAAIKDPWKTAVSYALDAVGDGALAYLERAGFVQKYSENAIKQLMLVCRSHELSPLASGAGRLFDAVSALLGICDKNTFEGEAAIALESFTREGIEDAYEVAFDEKNGYSVVRFGPLFQGIGNDRVQGVTKEIIATKFHNTIAKIIQTMVRSLSRAYTLREVALSGGTFQNQYLLNKTIQLLIADNMKVFTNHQVPCNDACISLGQAYLVRERLR